jgi:hypothetical protein
MSGARFYDGLHPTAYDVVLRASSAEVVATLADGRIVARWPVPEIEVVSDPWQEPHALMVCPRQPGARLAIEDLGYREALAALAPNMSRAAPRRSRVTPVLGSLVAALVLTIGTLAVLIERAHPTCRIRWSGAWAPPSSPRCRVIRRPARRPTAWPPCSAWSTVSR